MSKYPDIKHPTVQHPNILSVCGRATCALPRPRQRGDNMSPNKGTQRITSQKEYGKRSPGLIYMEQVKLKAKTMFLQTKENRESLPKKNMGKGARD